MMKLRTMALLLLLPLGGCMLARGPMGEIVLGVDVGALPETTSEVAGALVSTFAGPQIGGLVSTALATILAGGSAVAAAKSGSTKERRRKEADQGREKAEKEAVALKAILQATGILKPQPPSNGGDNGTS